MKKAAALLTAAVMLTVPLNAQALDTEQADGYARGIITYEKASNGIKDSDSLFTGKIAENAATDSSDWLVIGAVRCGLENDTAEYYSRWKNRVDDKYTHDAGLERLNATEWHRAVLTCLCLGADPSDLSGIDLLADGIYDRSEDKPLGKQGLNGWVWALIALDSCNWKTPDSAKVTRMDIVNKLLDSQNDDGGFSIEKNSGRSDPDLTAMTLQALSPYRSCDEADKVISSALDYLSESKSGFDTCETFSQVICALCCLGIDPDEDERFSDLTDSLISFSNDDGGFAHEKDGSSSEMASAQAMLALCSIERLRSGERSIYDMNEGKPSQPQEKSLAAAVEAKEVNTAAPHIYTAPSPLAHESQLRVWLIAALAACGVFCVTAGLLLRKRKEKTE